MADLSAKIDKQFVYQLTRYQTSGKPMDLFVSVDRLAGHLAAGLRANPTYVRAWVKRELERRAEEGQIVRWSERYGKSYRADRADHYFLREDAK